MAEARHVSVIVVYDGLVLMWMSEYLESLSYTDNASGAVDEIVLTFCSRATDYLRTTFFFEKEHVMEVTYYLKNWKQDGDILRYHCGTFVVDNISYSGSPRKCVIKGVSIPAEESFQTVPLSKSWANVTLKQIAQEMVAKYHMTDLYYWGDEPIIEKVEQDNKTDSEFLKELCDQQGMFLKVYKKAIVVFDKKVYEAKGVTASYTEKDFDGSYDWESTLVGTYTGATISYTVPRTEAEKKKKKKNEQPVIKITVGAGPRILNINQKVEGEADAERIAKAKVNLENEKAVKISFAAMEDPNVVASCNIEWTGMGRLDGKYFVEKVTHNISGSGGSKMKVYGYKIFDRL